MKKLDPELLRGLGLKNFIALDLETTGLEPHQAEVIELGAIRFVDGEPEEKFSALVQPEGELPPIITALTGIGPEDLNGAPPLGEVLPEFLQFIGGGKIVAHKAEFDRGFLEAAAAGLGISLPRYEWLDTLLLARALLPRSRNHKLGTLAEGLGLPQEGPHRAAADAARAGYLLIELLERGLEVGLGALKDLAGLSPPELRGIFSGLVDFRRERGLLGERRAAQAPLWEPHPREAREDFRLDPDQVEPFFKREGPLAQRLTSFSERPEQIAMAHEVAQAFDDSRFLIAEAGTGTGKSFAYLVPAILWARGRGHDGRVVVSTNTKNLQDQLFSKDIPVLKGALGDFQAVLLKGRANYICLHKWESLLLESAGGLGLAPEEELLSIPVWLEETETGDIAENNGFWKGERARETVKRLNDDPDYCLGRECSFYESCFSIRARRAAREAEIVVVNHALLLADLELDHGILGEYKYLIVDEAHNLEDAASEHLTRRLSFWEINDLLKELHRAKGPRLSGLLPLLRGRIGRSRLKDELKEKILGKLEEGIDLVGVLRRRNEELFTRLTVAVREKRRIEEEDYPLEHPEKERYDGRLFEGLEDESEELRVGLALLAALLERIEGALEGLDEQQLSEQKGLLGQTAAALAGARRLLGLLEFITAADDQQFVFWFELPAVQERFAALYATPLEVAPLLYEGLFKGLESAVFTSATLAVAGDFHYLEEHLGLDRLEGRLRAHSFGDPFDYRENARLAVPEFLPEPLEEGFHRELAELLSELAARIGRRTMVLFTSHKLLRQVHGRLQEAGEEEIFAQGFSGSRAQLMEEFRHSPTKRAILLGTSSFWEGVDLPGEDLEILVLTKLPFPVPGEPVVEARAEQIEAAGGDSFWDYFLPQAVLKLRQGFGRLIRTDQDRGAVIIADNRIVHRGYGHSFRKSLPLPLTTYYTPSRLLVELGEFFAQGE